jgi:hypothetical protein
MSTRTRDERWAVLRESGIVAGAKTPDVGDRSPWYIGALLGIAAWLAALFLMFFIGMAVEDIVRKPAGAIACGLVVTALAGWVVRRTLEHAFVAQLAIAFSVAGQCLLVVGLVMEGGRAEPLRWLLFVAIEAALVVAVPHFAHRVLATIGGAGALFMALWSAGLAPLFLPLVLFAFVAAEAQTLRGASNPQLWHATQIGLVLAVIVAIALAQWPRELALGRARSAFPVDVMRWVVASSIAAVGAWTGSLLVRDATGASRSPLALVAAALLAAFAFVGMALPGIAAAVLVLLLAFAAGQPVLGGLAMIALLGSLAHYYYRLDATLLAKSGGLASIGALLLIARAVLPRFFGPRTEVRDA